MLDQTLYQSLNASQTSVDILRSDVEEATRHKDELAAMISKTVTEVRSEPWCLVVSRRSARGWHTGAGEHERPA